MCLQELQQQRDTVQKQLQDVVQQLQLMTNAKQDLQHQVQELQQQQLQNLQQRHQEADRKVEAQQQASQLQQLSLYGADDGKDIAIGNGVGAAAQQQSLQEQHRQDLAAQGSRHGSINGLLQLMGLSEHDDKSVPSSATDSPLARSSMQRSLTQPQQQQRHGSLGLGTRQLSGSVYTDMQRLVQQQQQELQAAVKERDAAVEQLYQAVRQSDAAVAAMQEAEKAKQQQKELERKVSCTFMDVKFVGATTTATAT